MKKSYLSACLVAGLLAACARQAGPKQEPQPQSTALPGDSSVYGLACDGCTDTLLILLTRPEANPDTFDILEAMERHQVFGRPKTGDRMAVAMADTAGKAAIVIDLEDLMGDWRREVTPTLKQRAGMSSDAMQRMDARMPDSVRQRLLRPIEVGFHLKSEHVAQPIGAHRKSDENSPVTYPRQPRYHQWNILNGRLVLSETKTDSTGVRTLTHSDTTELVRLRRDTLTLRFADGEQTFYRKQAK